MSEISSSASFIVISTILTTIVVGTFVGNLFVITAILIDKNLQTTANQLVLSLAVADLMVACLVMPLGAYNDLHQGWYLGKEVCEFWTSADVLCCTASILNLLAIALDRYWAVTNVDYIYRRTRQRVNTMILCVWTAGAIVSLAPIFGWKDPDFSDRVLVEHKCMVSQDVAYQVFATISTFYAPLVVLLALYWRIFQVARKRIRRKPGQERRMVQGGRVAVVSAGKLIREDESGLTMNCPNQAVGVEFGAQEERVAREEENEISGMGQSLPTANQIQVNEVQPAQAEPRDDRQKGNPLIANKTPIASDSDENNNNNSNSNNNNSNYNPSSPEAAPGMGKRVAQIIRASRTREAEDEDRKWGVLAESPSERPIRSSGDGNDGSKGRRVGDGGGGSHDGNDKTMEENDGRLILSSRLLVRGDQPSEDCAWRRRRSSSQLVGQEFGANQLFATVTQALLLDGQKLASRMDRRQVKEKLVQLGDEENTDNPNYCSSSLSARLACRETRDGGIGGYGHHGDGHQIGRASQNSQAAGFDSGVTDGISKKGSKQHQPCPPVASSSADVSSQHSRARGCGAQVEHERPPSTLGPLTTMVALNNGGSCNKNLHESGPEPVCGPQLPSPAPPPAQNPASTPMDQRRNKARLPSKTTAVCLAGQAAVSGGRQNMPSPPGRQSCAMSNTRKQQLDDAAPSFTMKATAASWKSDTATAEEEGYLAKGELAPKMNDIRYNEPLGEPTAPSEGCRQVASAPVAMVNCCCCCRRRRPDTCSGGPNGGQMVVAQLESGPISACFQCLAEDDEQKTAGHLPHMDHEPPAIVELAINNRARSQEIKKYIMSANKIDQDKSKASKSKSCSHKIDSICSHPQKEPNYKASESAAIVNCSNAIICTMNAGDDCKLIYNNIASKSVVSLSPSPSSSAASSGSSCSLVCNETHHHHHHSTDDNKAFVISGLDHGSPMSNLPTCGHVYDSDEFGGDDDDANDEIGAADSEDLNDEEQSVASLSAAFPPPIELLARVRPQTTAKVCKSTANHADVELDDVDVDGQLLPHHGRPFESLEVGALKGACEHLLAINRASGVGYYGPQTTTKATKGLAEAGGYGGSLRPGLCGHCNGDPSLEAPNSARQPSDIRLTSSGSAAPAMAPRKLLPDERGQGQKVWPLSSGPDVDGTGGLGAGEPSGGFCGRTQGQQMEPSPCSPTTVAGHRVPSLEPSLKQPDHHRHNHRTTTTTTTTTRSLDIKRKFRALGQLVSFVQTSRNFNSSSSAPDSPQSGEEDPADGSRRLRQQQQQVVVVQVSSGAALGKELAQPTETSGAGQVEEDKSNVSVMDSYSAALAPHLQFPDSSALSIDRQTGSYLKPACKPPNNHNYRDQVCCSDSLLEPHNEPEQITCSMPSSSSSSSSATTHHDQIDGRRQQKKQSVAPAPATSSGKSGPLNADSLMSVAGSGADSQLNRRRANLDIKREKKAAKTLAIITGVFVCCWLPFFLNAIIMPVCGPSCIPSDLILSVLLWLGYLNSLLNPIIYTIFSPDFRLAFRRLLCWPPMAAMSASGMGKKSVR